MKQARDELTKEAPTNFYQFERDFKSFRADEDKQLAYLKNIKAENYKQIFKNDLETDVMLNILKTYNK